MQWYQIEQKLELPHAWVELPHVTLFQTLNLTLIIWYILPDKAKFLHPIGPVGLVEPLPVEPIPSGLWMLAFQKKKWES